jgi:hypothetical protein
MEGREPTYPQLANNPMSKVGNFWTEEMGRSAHPDNIEQRQNQLFYAPHLPLDGDYQEELREDIRGEISDRAIRKILGDEWHDLGLDDPRLFLELREVTASDPDTYTATMRATDLDETSARGIAYEAHPEGYLLLDRIPRDMDTDSDFYFTVTGGRGYQRQNSPGKSLSDREEFTVF